eukprot:Phypoly_transcript_00205.p1 GENE.Phypoly_transcript_00205~~Phypoly_transcript_00205.p1  ORF type:complete len:1663 (+),score=204.04 Phypoly_transcript_00205:71-5059(+)
MENNDPAVIGWLGNLIPSGKLNNLKVSREIYAILIDKDDLALSISDNSYQERFQALRSRCDEQDVKNSEQILQVAIELFPDSVPAPATRPLVSSIPPTSNSNGHSQSQKKKQYPNSKEKTDFKPGRGFGRSKPDSPATGFGRSKAEPHPSAPPGFGRSKPSPPGFGKPKPDTSPSQGFGRSSPDSANTPTHFGRSKPSTSSTPSFGRSKPDPNSPTSPTTLKDLGGSTLPSPKSPADRINASNPSNPTSPLNSSRSDNANPAHTPTNGSNAENEHQNTTPDSTNGSKTTPSPTSRFKYSKNSLSPPSSSKVTRLLSLSTSIELDKPIRSKVSFFGKQGEQLTGRISSIEHHEKFYEGRIKCIDKKYDGEYHFVSENVNMADRDYLRKRDEVKFSVSGTVILDESGEQAMEHEAYSIKLLKCTYRSPEEIIGYLDRLCLVKGSHSKEGSGIDALLMIVPAYFDFIINRVRDMASISKLMQAHYQLNKSLTIHKARLQIYNRFFTDTDLVRIWLPKWVAEADVERDTVARLGKLFVKRYMQYCPMEAMRAIVPLAEKVAPLLENREVSERFLVRALRKTMASLHSANVKPWNEIPLVLESQEVLSPPRPVEELPKMVVSAPYDDIEHYLRTNFSLLREACFKDMRHSIYNVVQGKPAKANVYTHVRMTEFHFHKNHTLGVCYCINFKSQVTNWEDNGNLSYGNLLCISVDGTFNKLVWATVAISRNSQGLDLLKNGQVFVSLLSDYNSMSDSEALMLLQDCNMEQSIMVESPVFYISYRSSLEALQKRNESTLPFIDEFVHMKPSKPPSYITPETEVGWSAISEDTMCNLMSEMDEVLGEEKVQLDQSQKEAIRHVLTHEVAIIQGPPGTGKSYVGSKIIQLLLTLSTLPPGPILLMTYKNKALDTTLKECLKFTSEVVRVGGGCQDPELEPKMLYPQFARRLHSQENVKAKRLHRQSLQELARIRPRAQEWASDLQHLTKTHENEIILSFKSFIREATLEQALSLVSDESERDRAEVLAREIDNIGKIMARNTWNDYLELREILERSYVRWLPSREEVRQLIADETEADFKIQVNAHESDSETEPSEVRKSITNDDDAEDWRDQQENKISSSIYFTIGARYLPKNIHRRENLSQLNPRQRAIFLLAVLASARARIQRGFAETMQDYNTVCSDLQDTIDGVKLQILRKARVVGFTVTGGAIHSRLISALKPSVVIVEEAGEVLEPHMIAALPSTVKHYIQIGDHKQLQPTCDFKLAKVTNFAVSQMERMINNNSPHVTLRLQNRMRTEFVPFLAQFYPNLESNPRVDERPAPPCMGASFAFWAHHSIEVSDRCGVISNPREADMAVFLASWLSWHSTETGKDITILALYKGQVNLIKNKLLKLSEDQNLPAAYREALSNIFVGTVDNFQGAENRTVILSLVRNNMEQQFGFSAIPNRVCVALSRAQSGLYVIGSKYFFEKSMVWAPIVKSLQPTFKLGVCCSRHPDEQILSPSSQSEKLPRPEWLCRKLCGGETGTCEHPCSARCHPGPHPPCSHPLPFECPDCQHKTTFPCGWPRELLLCDKCHPTEASCVSTENGASKMKRSKSLPLKQGEIEVRRSMAKHIRVVKQITTFLTADRGIQFELVRCQELINPSLMDRWDKQRSLLPNKEYIWGCHVPSPGQKN